MSSVQTIAASSFAASMRQANLAVRKEAEELRAPAAFTTPRADEAADGPAVSEALDIKNIVRARAYADAFGMPVDPTKDITMEGVASLFARYSDATEAVIERITGASFKVLLDMKV